MRWKEFSPPLCDFTKSLFSQAFADLSKDLKPLLDGVQENKKQWLELGQTAQETMKNRKNSQHSMNGTINNHSFSFNNNNNGDEITNISSNESRVMSKIVGKFPLDSNGIASTNSLFSSTYIKPSNGLITTYTTPSIANYNNWKKIEDHHEVMDQWELFRRGFFFKKS